MKTTREKEILIFPTNYPNDTLNNKNRGKKTPHRCSDTRIQYLLVIFYSSYRVKVISDSVTTEYKWDTGHFIPRTCLCFVHLNLPLGIKLQFSKKKNAKKISPGNIEDHHHGTCAMLKSMRRVQRRKWVTLKIRWKSNRIQLSQLPAPP